MNKPKGGSVFGPGGLRVVFDPNDIYTPCMVYLKVVGQKVSATFMCAHAEGEVEGYELNKAQCDFLDKLEARADEFYDAHTHNNPENVT